MINRNKEIHNMYSLSERTIEALEVYHIVSNLITKIELLESICEELVRLPKGVESHSWSDYKEENQDDTI